VSHRLGLCMLVLVQASVDACNDPLDHLSDSVYNSLTISFICVVLIA
jgi:hypothetical protein